MSAGLFRAQVRAHAQTAWLGRIVLIRPLSFTVLTLWALGIAAALLAYFVAGEYTRKARVAGVLAPAQGVVKIVAQQSGIVELVLAKEGEGVALGARLLVIGDARADRARVDIGTAVGARLLERQRALLQQRTYSIGSTASEIAALDHRHRALAREIDQIDIEIAAQAARTTLSSEGLARATRLAATGFLSRAGLDHERDAALEQAARREGLERSRMALVRELEGTQLEGETARARGNAQLAALDTQRAAIEQERVERELQYGASIVAPAAGTIATVLVDAGQMVVPGTPLATIIPDGSALEAHLFSPSRSIGFVRTGQEVLVRYLAYPYQKFGSHRARVVAVSRNPMLPGELGFTPPDGAREPLYRIKVALAAQDVLAYGRPEPLQAGMQVEADILLDRRRLIEWVFEPLLSLAGRA